MASSLDNLEWHPKNARVQHGLQVFRAQQNMERLERESQLEQLRASAQSKKDLNLHDTSYDRVSDSSSTCDLVTTFQFSVIGK